MVDRDQRDRLAALIRRYLAGEVRSYGFRDQLAEFKDSSDSAVGFVAKQEWCFYGDTEDIPAYLSKAEWDFTQRLLLLLESNFVVRKTVSVQWSVSQWLTLLTLLSFLWIGYQQGWSDYFFVLMIPFGLVPAAIIWVGRESLPGPFDRILFPFANITELKSACQSLGFRKVRYPERMKQQVIVLQAGKSTRIPIYLFRLILLPCNMFFQMLPIRKTQIKVVHPIS